MSKPSSSPSRESDIATLRTDVEQLKVLTRGLRPHRLRDHTDVIVQGATPGAAMAYGGEAEGGKWRPGSAGADLPVIHLASTTTTVPTGLGTALEWDTPDGATTVNLGGAFAFDIGTPTDIECLADCVIDLDACLRWQPDAGQWRLLTVNGIEWGPTQFQEPTIAAHGDQVTSLVSMKGVCLTGNIIQIVAAHDQAGDLNVSDGFVSVSRVCLL